MKTVQLKFGERFGKLKVIKLHHIEKDKRNRNIEYYLCRCDCGNECIINKIYLKTKETKSCGCLKKENMKKTSQKTIKHNKTHTRLYNIWRNIKQRCFYKINSNYKNYGGRGIEVCDEWLDKENGFINFYNWAMDNGYKDDLTIDRIDVNGNYEPNNCRWANLKTQAKNRRNNHIIEYNGEKHCISEWAEILKINYNTLLSRVRRKKY